MPALRPQVVSESLVGSQCSAACEVSALYFRLLGQAAQEQESEQGMSAFQQFEAEQKRLQRKIDQAVAAQRRRDKPVHVSGKQLKHFFLWFVVLGSILACAASRWLAGR